ncbi:AAA family ATPase [Anaerolineales bacterium HSG24]|nr:AAA family ATPase [Anaerolineales bacterium HSG24]
MKKLPVGIYSFEFIRKNNYVYVDKTEHVYRMVDQGMFYFLSRPRRFGKSLLVTTLLNLFAGRKELFEGLWITEHGDWDWQPHPVILLDFNGIPGQTPEVLREDLSARLKQIATDYEIALTSNSVERQFQELILALYRQTGMPVVILIDEYDKRIIEHIGRGEAALEIGKANRDVLKSFFGVLKDTSIGSALRFVFLTGVSKFSRVSIFSELNNLYDLTMNRNYADMLGYTQAELKYYFQDNINLLAIELDMTVEQVMSKLEQYYNGYRFSEKDVKVYNPFSILCALQEKAFKNYWFETGTPTFLINLLKETGYNLPQMEQLEISQSSFSTFEIDNLIPEAVLFQTGYLTIETVIDDSFYTLSYPNQEVRIGFNESLFFAWGEGVRRAISSHVLRLNRYLAKEKLESFFESMTAIFAAIPYDIQTKRDEAYYHTLFYLMMTASGGDAQSSLLTCRGRIDMVISFKDKIYIFEFKCNKSAEVALKQIEDKGYADRYKATCMPVILIGLNFSTEKRNLEEWKVKRLLTPAGSTA